MSAAPDKGMVLAAGLGTRMRPLTLSTPKPLIPVQGRTLLDRTLDWMEQGGIISAVVNTHYLAPQVEAHLKHRAHPRITLSCEADELLETGGGIARALTRLGTTPFICANSDTICINGTTHAIARLAQNWRDAEMDALLLLHPIEKAVGYNGKGDFTITPGGALARRGSAASAPYVFTGVQLLHPRLFNSHPPGAFSMNLLYDKTPGRVHGIVHDGAWLHVGDPQGLRDAENWLSSNH